MIEQTKSGGKMIKSFLLYIYMKLFYIDEQDKRLFRVLIACIVFLFLITPFKVSAESGQITSTLGVGASYSSTGGITPSNVNFTHFQFYSTAYNHLTKIEMTIPGSTFPLQSNSTSGTITTGGTGSFFVSYDKNASKIIYYFTNTNITGSDVTLNLDSNIFSGVSANVKDAGSSSCGSLNANCPLFFFSSSPNIASDISYIVQVQTTVENDYNVTYPSNGFFVVNINKSMATVTTKIFINNATSTSNNQNYFNESTFNTVSFTSPILQYLSGIQINMSVSNGEYVVTNVNTTGAVADLPPTDGGGGSISGQIYFDYSNASLASGYGINASLLSANYSSSSTYYIKTTDPSGNIVSGFPIDFSTQTYSTGRMWTFSSLGIYNSTLAFCRWYDIICKEEVLLTGFPDETGSDPLTGKSHVIDTARITINPIQYAYSITTDKDNYITGDIIHITAVNPSPSNTYVNMNLLIGGQNPIEDMLISPNTTKLINVTVSNDMLFGTWQVNLNTKQDGVGQVAVKTFTIGIPTVADKKLGLRWDVNNYIGRTNNLYYTTNDNSSTVRVYKVFPGSTTSTLADTFTANGSTSAFVPYLMDVPGFWNASITDNGNSSNITHANMTVIAAEPTLICNNALPDSVCWDKFSYNRGDAFVINYKATNVPSIVEVRLLILDPDNNNVLNKSICSTKLLAPNPCGSPQTGTFAKSFTSTAKFGKWHAILMIDGTAAENYMDGSVLADSYAVVVSRGGVEEGGVNNTVFTGSCGSNDVVCKIDGWTAMFGLGVNDVSRFLFAVIIIAVMALFGFLAANNLYGGVTMGFIPFAFFTYINYVPRWFAVVLVILMAIRMRVFN